MAEAFIDLGLFAIITALLYGLLIQMKAQRSQHKELMDRFMAVSETLGSYRARQEQAQLEDGEYLFIDQQEQDVTKRVIVRGGQSTVEEIEGTMGPVTTGESPA